jgi:hypothetical protein
MKLAPSVFIGTFLGLVSLIAIAQTSTLPVQEFDECSDIISLRNRDMGVAAALQKLEAGATITLTQNADVTARFMMLSIFDSYLCKLDKVTATEGGISMATRQAWLKEINDAFDIINAAAAGQSADKVVAEVNKARSAVTSPWAKGGSKYVLYDTNLTVNRMSDFLKVVPKVDFTKDVNARGYVKMLYKVADLKGNYTSSIAKGEQISGNLLYSVEDMRKNLANYATGSSSAATMLSIIIGQISSITDQIANKRAAEMQLGEFAVRAKYEAEAKAGTPAVVSALDTRLVTLEKAVAELRIKWDSLPDSAASSSAGEE